MFLAPATCEAHYAVIPPCLYLETLHYFDNYRALENFPRPPYSEYPTSGVSDTRK